MTNPKKIPDDLDGVFFRPENIGWLLVIKGYFDETFDDYSGRVWVAGYYGDESAWTKYVSDWRPALGRRKRLHMSSLRWKKQSERDLLTRLAPIPHGAGLKPIVGGVNSRDIAGLVKGTRLEYFANGYLLSLIDAATQAILRVPDGEHLEIRFEDRDQTRECAQNALDAMRLMGLLAGYDNRLLNSDGSLKLSAYGFMPKSNTVLFDQADYLCYALLQRCRDSHSRKAAWSSPILEHVPLDDSCGIMNRQTAQDALIRTLRVAS